jgi:hypothetical protein
MPLPEAIFDIQLGLGYVPWLLVFAAYGWPRLRAMDAVAAQRVIAALHSFRFFGLVFLLPGVVGPQMPPGWAPAAAWGDFATGVLAMLALMTVRVRPVFWSLTLAFNLVGALDILVDYGQGVSLGLTPAALGSTYVIPIVYVPILMITHVAALALLMRRAAKAAPLTTPSSVRT